MTLIILDFNRTIYDPETGALYSDAMSFLDALRAQKSALVLVSRDEGSRLEKIQQLGIAPYFDSIHFVPEKTVALFADIVRSYRDRVTYVVGDHLEDVRCGNGIRAKTIRILRGKFAHVRHRVPEETAWRTETNLMDALKHIR